MFVYNYYRRLIRTEDSESVINHYIGGFMTRTYKYFIEENELSVEDSFGNFVRYKRNKE